MIARRALGLLLVASAVALVPAGPAAADDEFEIDGRLADMGYEEAFTTPLGYGRGVRVHVDYRSLSRSEAAYEQEARRAAEVVWEHLEYRVLAVDVAPTAGVVWRDGDVPPAVSMTRTDLTAAFGARPGGLDDADPWGFEEDFGEVGAVGAAIAWSVLGLLLLGGVWLVVHLVRSRRRRPEPDPWSSAYGGWAPAPGGWSQAGWGGPAQQGAPGWAAPPHGAPPPGGGWPQPGHPPAAGPPPAGAAGPAADPWRTP